MYEKVWNHHKIAYGGDYNPEQWSEDVWEEDMRMFRLAHIDTVTLNVFSWATLQTDENTYNFEKLDKIMDLVEKNGLKVCLATSTGAHPAWMARKYPEILRTEYNGLRRKFGGRHNSCPNSIIYQRYSTRLASRLALRYGQNKNVIGWHISNEYGGACYCENCEKAFRIWLKKKYETIDALNKAWNTAFWGHTFYDWEEIVAPNLLSEHFQIPAAYGNYEKTMFQGISLDYQRFNSDSMLHCFQLEYLALKEITPDIPITTNLMGTYKPLDYGKWANYMDFIAWDNYPSNGDSPANIALNHDVMRGIKQGAPFILMEQTPSVTNWQPYNYLKRPGVMRLWSYQAVAHGSDSVMFFQMRRSIGACEKYHGAVIEHVGSEKTRVFRELQELGAELDKIGDKTLGARGMAKIAIVFDWENWWAVEFSAGPSQDIYYRNEVLRYYEALHKNHYAVDIVGVFDDFNGYDIVIAPVLYMNKTDFDDKVREYVKNGGTFVTTYFSGYVNENDLVLLGGYPAKWRDFLGIWVEESDALYPEDYNLFEINKKQYKAKIICDIIHLEGAEVVATYEKDFYQGTPVITRNTYGEGITYYIGTSSEEEFYLDFVEHICKEKGIEKEARVPDGIEAVRRQNVNGIFLFLLNHTDNDLEFEMEKDCVDIITERAFCQGQRIMLKKKDVVILHLEGDVMDF